MYEKIMKRLWKDYKIMILWFSNISNITIEIINFKNEVILI